MTNDLQSQRHPHEPEIPPTYDDEAHVCLCEPVPYRALEGSEGGEDG